jgi:hypothetical protein
MAMFLSGFSGVADSLTFCTSTRGLKLGSQSTFTLGRPMKPSFRRISEVFQYNKQE